MQMRVILGRYVLPMLVVSVLLFGIGGFVSTAFAIDENALVTCDGTSIKGGIACNFCTFIEMVVKVVNFIVMILVIVSVIMLAWTGIQMAYTAAGGSDARAILKERMTNIVIGFLLIIASWTIIDTALKALVLQDVGIVEVWKTGSNDLCDKMLVPDPNKKTEFSDGVSGGSGASGSWSESD